MSNNLIKLALGLKIIEMLIPIPVETLFLRFYMGKYKVMVIDRVLNKSYVEFLEKGIVGNKKVGYRETEIGECLFVYTRSCWRNKKKVQVN